MGLFIRPTPEGFRKLGKLESEKVLSCLAGKCQYPTGNTINGLIHTAIQPNSTFHVSRFQTGWVPRLDDCMELAHSYRRDQTATPSISRIQNRRTGSPWGEEFPSEQISFFTFQEESLGGMNEVRLQQNTDSSFRAMRLGEKG